MSWNEKEPFTLFGSGYDDETVSRFLAEQAPHTVGKPSDGSQYVVSKDGGFDLLFEDPDNRGAGNKQKRMLVAIFLYDEGVDGHGRYTGPLPLGFSFEDRRADLIAKRTPSVT